MSVKRENTGRERGRACGAVIAAGCRLRAPHGALPASTTLASPILTGNPGQILPHPQPPQLSRRPPFPRPADGVLGRSARPECSDGVLGRGSPRSRATLTLGASVGSTPVRILMVL